MGGAPRWTAQISKDGRTDIYGYFAGRPSADAAGALMQQILDGKVQPLSSVSAGGKDITINIPK